MSKQEKESQQNQQEDKQTRGRLLKSIYEQHWLHARHVENERLWITNIFGIIVAGLLAFLGNQGLSPDVAIIAGSFIFILSLFGYSLCLSWRAPILEHSTLANKLLGKHELSEYAPYISKSYRKVKIGWLTVHEFFLYFYSLMAGGGWFLIIYWGMGKGEAKCPYLWISIAVTITVSLSLCLLWRGLLRKREVEYRKEMGVREW